MAEPFLGEIRMMSFNYAPRGWALCNGQLLPINQNQALFALLGTMYGGDGRTTFALPNLQGRVVTHQGAWPVGVVQGRESVSLTVAQMPTHTHGATAEDGPALTDVAVGGFLATRADAYGPADGPLVPLSAASVDAAGQGQPHENRQPYLVLARCIALQGIFPSQN